MKGGLVAAAWLVAACASFPTPAGIEEGTLRARADGMDEDGIRIAAALLTPDEQDAVFGVDLASKGIEPVWLEIENTRDHPVHFLISGMDPEYFAPLEVAHLYRARFAGDRNARVADHIAGLAIDYRSAIAPGAVVRGYAYTNDTKGAKVLDVDLVADGWASSRTLFVRDPAQPQGASEVARIQAQFSEQELVHIDDEAGLREALEALPACAESEDGEIVVPLNLFVISELRLGISAFQRRGYRLDESPSLFAFGRPQDSVATKSARWVDPQPQQVRLWQTPLRYRSVPVWLAQVSMPEGGRFARRGAGIDRFVDRARDAVVQDLLYSQHVTRIGRARGAVCPPGKGRIQTDGLRWVLLLDERAIALDELQFFEPLPPE